MFIKEDADLQVLEIEWTSGTGQMVQEWLEAIGELDYNCSVYFNRKWKSISHSVLVDVVGLVLLLYFGTFIKG